MLARLFQIQKEFSLTFTRIAVFSALAAGLNCNAGLMTYTDTVGDQEVYPSNKTLDITAVDVSNTGSALSFKILLNGPLPAGSGSAAFLVAIDSVSNKGANNYPDSGRPILLPGMDWLLESDGLTSKLSSWSYPSWSKQEAEPGIGRDASAITMTVNSSDLGLSLGSTIKFDVYTSFPGNQYSAFDALSSETRTILDPNTSYTSQGFNTYTLEAVPEPAHYGLICASGLLGLATVQTWRKRKAA